MIKRPEYVDRIIKYKDTPFVKILTGIRRCGKSTIMKMLMEEIRSKGIEENRIIHMNFDSLEYEEIKYQCLRLDCFYWLSRRKYRCVPSYLAWHSSHQERLESAPLRFL